jgi:hypothetical protein
MHKAQRHSTSLNERQLDLAEGDVHRTAGKGELTYQPHGLIALHVSQLCKYESMLLKWGIMQGQVPEHQGLQTRDSAVRVLRCSTVLHSIPYCKQYDGKVISHQPATCTGPGYDPRSVHVVFMVEKFVLEQVLFDNDFQVPSI